LAESSPRPAGAGARAGGFSVLAVTPEPGRGAGRLRECGRGPAAGRRSGRAAAGRV